MDRDFLFSKKMLAFIMVFLVVLMAAAFALQFSKEKARVQPALAQKDLAPPASSGEGLSKVVYKVSNMSCSGCIFAIKSSLAGFQGVEEVLVDLGGGKAEVYYRQEGGADVAKMAQAITESGYPAKT